MIERLRSHPSIVSATHSQTVLTGMLMTIPLKSPFTSAERPIEAGSLAVSSVGRGYFRTFGIPLLSGTGCPDRDDGPAAILGATAARLLFPGRSPMGQPLALSGEGTFTVVGVAADVRALGTNAIGLPRVYACVGSGSAPALGTIAIRVRDGINPLAMVSTLREAVQSVDPTQPVARIQTLRESVGEAVTDRWFEAALITSFAGLAVALAVFGLYAVVAIVAAQRTHEIGVRVALGASRRDILTLVLSQGATLTLTGAALGVLAALPLVRLIRSMLFEVTTLDAGVFAGATAALVTVALTAIVVPALRAARVDPTLALRAE